MSPVKRRYHAPVRQEQAAQTRQRIATAAAVEFAEHGWAGTTIAAIAARAQVTPQAVHLAVGGKAALLVRAVEVTVAGATDDELLADRPAFAAVYAPDVPIQRRLAALAAAAGGVYRRAGRLFLVLQDAAASDATAAELAAQASGRRLADHRRLAELVLPDADPEQLQMLTDSIWVLTGPGVYVDLVHRRNWPPERYTAWLTDQLTYAVRAARRAGLPAWHGVRRPVVSNPSGTWTRWRNLTRSGGGSVRWAGSRRRAAHRRWPTAASGPSRC